MNLRSTSFGLIHLLMLEVGASAEVLESVTIDRYGRTVGELYVDGMSVQQAMVADRHPEIDWENTHQCPWTRSKSPRKGSKTIESTSSGDVI